MNHQGCFITAQWYEVNAKHTPSSWLFGMIRPGFLGGTMNRRNFLKASSLALMTLQGMPNFLARARDLAQGDKTLVVVQLSGGNDGLNTLVPFSNGAYYAARSNIAIGKKEVIPVSADLGMHPNLRSLASFFDEGQLAWIEGVGYPNPNRSHFASMAIWHTADPEQASSEGWIGRMAEQIGDPLCASSIGKYRPLALHSESISPPTIENLDKFKLALDDLQNPFDTILKLAREGQAAYIQSSIKQMLENTSTVQARLNRYQSSATYPENDFARNLQQVARLISTGLNQRVLYVSLGGFDTHAYQRESHDELMLILAEGLKSFYQDLEAQGLSEKVAVLGFSEFGRRVAENGSDGTDHGQGGVMFALGKGIKGGIYGNSPDLENLEKGDIRYQQDFRGVYAKVLDNWLGISSQAILGNSFTGPEFV
jgi:uncharacterized protein (DUF1501 family)